MPKTPLKIVEPSAEIIAMRDEVVQVLNKYREKVGAVDILAIFAHLTGQALAMQDQRVMTVDMGMDVICKNIEQGNYEVIKNPINSEGGHS